MRNSFLFVLAEITQIILRTNKGGSNDQHRKCHPRGSKRRFVDAREDHRDRQNSRRVDLVHQRKWHDALQGADNRRADQPIRLGN